MNNLATVQNGTSVSEAIQNNEELRKTVNDLYEEQLRNNSDAELPVIQIGHQVGQFIDPMGEAVKELRAVILDTQEANSYWAVSETEGENNPPDCYSLDGKRPAAESPLKQSERCQNCPKNQFGSDGKTNGKACKNMRRLVLLQDKGNNQWSICRLTLPPSSLKAWKEYIGKLMYKGLPHHVVITRFSLNVKSNGQQKYSVVEMNVLAELTGEQVAGVVDLRNRVKARRQDNIDTEKEYPTSGNGHIAEATQPETLEAAPDSPKTSGKAE